MYLSRVFLIILAVKHYECDDVNKNERRKRTIALPLLLMPPTAPTRHQLIWGVGIPSQIGYESIVWGLTLKAQYYLASGAQFGTSQLKPSYFPGFINSKRKRRELHESYNVSAEVIEEEPLHESYMGPEKETSMTRWIFYGILEELSKHHKLGEKECVLRTVCEAAQIPFNYMSGLLGELLHIIFTPSSSPDSLSKHSDNEYLYAEQMGQLHERCDLVFKECKESLLDIFSGVYDPLFYQMIDADT